MDDVNDVAWLNANGSIGFDVAEMPDYPRLADCLEEMDRLGVGEAVVWNKSCVPHAPHGNRRLLEVIDATPTARDRVIPALVVAPAMLYERGALDEVRAMMNDRGIRVLRALPRSLGYRMQELEPVLAELAAFKPVVMVSVRTLGEPSGLLSLAERFEAISFIVTDAMWPQMGTVFDLMRRCDNILAETSWMHSQGAVALLAKQFGAHRVVFGMGPRSHAGAAIAGLAKCDLDRAAKRLIARTTMANLAGRDGLDSNAAVAMRGGKRDDSLWAKLLRGEQLDVPIIDAHAHLGGSSRWILEESDPAILAEQMVERMDRIGIDTTVVFLGSNVLADDAVAGNERIEAVTRPYHGRLKGMIYFHPAYVDALTAKLDEWLAGEFFLGFKVLCSYWKVPVTDAAFTPMWEYANRHRLPILLHTWGSGQFDSPGRVAQVVEHYPDAIFILGHSGGDNAGRPEAEALASAKPNVYMEWCGSFCSTWWWEKTLERVGPHKLLFGTDAVVHDVYWELGRLLSLDVPDSILKPILGENLRGIWAQRR